MPPVACCHDDAEPRAVKVRKINFSVRYVDACFKGIGITLAVYQNGVCATSFRPFKAICLISGPSDE